MEKLNIQNSASGLNKSKSLFIIIGVAVLLMAAIWIFKSVEINNIQKTAEKNNQVLMEQATKQIVQSHTEHLKLLAKPFVWAIRADMMQGNIYQLNLFISDMVKEKNLQSIVIANDKGIIISSTNKKNEGQPFSTVGNGAALSSNSTNVENIRDSLLVMTTPVMGFNNRLGTLLVEYIVPPPSLIIK